MPFCYGEKLVQIGPTILVMSAAMAKLIQVNCFRKFSINSSKHLKRVTRHADYGESYANSLLSIRNLWEELKYFRRRMITGITYNPKPLYSKMVVVN